MRINLAYRPPCHYNNMQCRGVAQSGARHVRDVEVAGSSPVAPTSYRKASCTISVEAQFATPTSPAFTRAGSFSYVDVRRKPEMGKQMTDGERIARLEAENVEIRTHFATKADLERGLRLQTGVLLGALVIAVGLIIAVLG